MTTLRRAVRRRARRAQNRNGILLMDPRRANTKRDIRTEPKESACPHGRSAATAGYAAAAARARRGGAARSPHLGKNSNLGAAHNALATITGSPSRYLPTITLLPPLGAQDARRAHHPARPPPTPAPPAPPRPEPPGTLAPPPSPPAAVDHIPAAVPTKHARQAAHHAASTASYRITKSPQKRTLARGASQAANRTASTSAAVKAAAATARVAASVQRRITGLPVSLLRVVVFVCNSRVSADAGVSAADSRPSWGGGR